MKLRASDEGKSVLVPIRMHPDDREEMKRRCKEIGIPMVTVFRRGAAKELELLEKALKNVA